MADENIDLSMCIKSEIHHDIEKLEDMSYADQHIYDNEIGHSEEKLTSNRVGLPILKITDQVLNIQLIKEVEKHEMIYNYNHPDYWRRDLTDKAWQEVASKVNLAVAECKEKWRNIRTVYIRKMKDPLNRSGRRRQAYYLADAMQFCLPYIKSLTPSGAVNPTEVSNSETVDNSVTLTWDSFTQDDPQPQDSPREESTVQEVIPETRSSTDDLVLPDQSNQSLRQSSLSQQNRMLKRRKHSMLNVNKCVAEYFKAKTAKLEKTIKEGSGISGNMEKKEALKMFLLSLLPELEDFSDSQIKLFKRQVFGVIDEITNSSQVHSVRFGGLMESPMSVSSCVSVISEQSQCSSVSHCSDLSRM